MSSHLLSSIFLFSSSSLRVHLIAWRHTQYHPKSNKVITQSPMTDLKAQEPLMIFKQKKSRLLRHLLLNPAIQAKSRHTKHQTCLLFLQEIHIKPQTQHTRLSSWQSLFVHKQKKRGTTTVGSHIDNYIFESFSNCSSGIKLSRGSKILIDRKQEEGNSPEQSCKSPRKCG